MKDADHTETLKALAHPLRLRILQALAGVERNVGEIESVADVGQPALSQQLAVLRKAGLVATRKEAKLVFYRIEDGRLLTLIDALSGLAGDEGQPNAARRQLAPQAANFARLG